MMILEDLIDISKLKTDIPNPIEIGFDPFLTS